MRHSDISGTGTVLLLHGYFFLGQKGAVCVVTCLCVSCLLGWATSSMSPGRSTTSSQECSPISTCVCTTRRPPTCWPTGTTPTTSSLKPSERPGGGAGQPFFSTSTFFVVVVVVFVNLRWENGTSTPCRPDRVWHASQVFFWSQPEEGVFSLHAS